MDIDPIATIGERLSSTEDGSAPSFNRQQINYREEVNQELTRLISAIKKSFDSLRAKVLLQILNNESELITYATRCVQTTLRDMDASQNHFPTELETFSPNVDDISRNGRPVIERSTSSRQTVNGDSAEYANMALNGSSSQEFASSNHHDPPTFDAALQSSVIQEHLQIVQHFAQERKKKLDQVIDDLKRRLFFAFSRHHKVLQEHKLVEHHNGTKLRVIESPLNADQRISERNLQSQTDALWLVNEFKCKQSVIATAENLRIPEDQHQDGPYYHGFVETSKYIFLLDKHNKTIKRYNKNYEATNSVTSSAAVATATMTTPQSSETTGRRARQYPLVKSLSNGVLIYDGSKWNDLSSLRVLRLHGVRGKILAVLFNSTSLLLLSLDGTELASINLRPKPARWPFGSMCMRKKSNLLLVGFSSDKYVSVVQINVVSPSNSNAVALSTRKKFNSKSDSISLDMQAVLEMPDYFRLFTYNAASDWFLFTNRFAAQVYKLKEHQSWSTNSAKGECLKPNTRWYFDLLTDLVNPDGWRDPHSCIMRGNLCFVVDDRSRIHGFALCGLVAHYIGFLNEPRHPQETVQVADWSLTRYHPISSDHENKFASWDEQFSFRLLVVDNSKRNTSGNTVFALDFALKA